MTHHVAVVGAGAFGGWSALELQRKGVRVTLIDAWGPGHSRSSSGGESRAIRLLYGRDRFYTELTIRSLVLWRRVERDWNLRLLHRAGVLWMCRDDDGYVRSSIPIVKEHGFPVRELTPAEASARYPQINFHDFVTVFLEEDMGFLSARRATIAVRDAFVDAGGEYVQATVRVPPEEGSVLRHLPLADGRMVEADAFLFACGGWLPQLFPDVLGKAIVPTRQEVMYFGTPPGDHRFDVGHLPVWADLGRRLVYGFPAAEGCGVKITDDTRGPPMDPSTEDRQVRASAVADARAYLARRFPGLAEAPVLETRVCQYENSPDGHYVLDRHPSWSNVWIMGGGSGHGFKLGPALGEYATRLVLDGERTKDVFALARLPRVSQQHTQFDHR